MECLSQGVAYFSGELCYSKWAKPIWQVDGVAAVTGDS